MRFALESTSGSVTLLTLDAEAAVPSACIKTVEALVKGQGMPWLPELS